MSTESIMTRIRPGMQVHTVDGHLLGNVTRVWFGRDPSANSPHCDDECCSRIEVQRRRMLTRQVRYVPLNAIAAVTTTSRSRLMPPPWTSATGPKHLRGSWMPFSSLPNSGTPTGWIRSVAR